MFEYLLSDLICVKLNQQSKTLIWILIKSCQPIHLKLFEIYAEIQQSKQYIEQNVQTNLVLDQLCIRLMNVK
jgi:DNA polymerase-3 subunit delta'